MNNKRGVIQYRARAEQGRDFSGLRFGSITPTDIDALIDFHDLAFVFIEAKHADAVMGRGQELALERVCDACQQSGRAALVLVVSHETPVTQQIDFASCRVVSFRYRGRWRTPKAPIVARAAVDKFLARVCGVEKAS